MTELPTPDRQARFLRIAGWTLAPPILIGLIGAFPADLQDHQAKYVLGHLL